jgi:hypothetical protein
MLQRTRTGTRTRLGDEACSSSIKRASKTSQASLDLLWHGPMLDAGSEHATRMAQCVERRSTYVGCGLVVALAMWMCV